MIKPDARIVPTEEEFEAWAEHPCTRFVAEAYRIGAEKQRLAWESYFDANLVPADISAIRLQLKTREDAYRSFMENTFADYIAIVEGASTGRTVRAPQAERRARA